MSRSRRNRAIQNSVLSIVRLQARFLGHPDGLQCPVPGGYFLQQINNGYACNRNGAKGVAQANGPWKQFHCGKKKYNVYRAKPEALNVYACNGYAAPGPSGHPGCCCADGDNAEQHSGNGEQLWQTKPAVSRGVSKIILAVLRQKALGLFSMEVPGGVKLQ